MTVTIDDIRTAAATSAGQVVRTPAVPAPRLAEATGATSVVLKLENLHTRLVQGPGAFNKLKSLTPAEAKNGVIAMSAGNHAQGVACFAQRLGIPAVIVMPQGTPFNKVERTRGSARRGDRGRYDRRRRGVRARSRQTREPHLRPSL
jgi:threonine dehydratase